MHKFEQFLVYNLKFQIIKALTGNKMETNKKFNKRAFISVGLIVSAIGLPFSGLMNHYMGFEPLTTARHFWMSVHDVSGILFTIFAITHIIFNWRSIKNYLSNFKKAVISKEALAAISLVIFVTALIASHAFHAG